ncbi:MAG: type II toxin-antitoxin system VapC family toxin [Deltaproteobacteria bacterium]
MRFLLDTNVVSEPVSASPNPKVIKRLTAHGAACAIPAPVWHELVFGAARLRRGKRKTALEDYLGKVVQATFPILPYDSDAAGWHAAERARLERAGRAAPFVDGQIAAIAHTEGLILVTANPKDFARFGELDVVDWAA